MQYNNFCKRRFVTIWIIRIILIALILFWMTIIFGFSSENGEQSQSLSDKITIRVIHLIDSDYDNLSGEKQKEFFDTVSFIVRKTGHFGEYAILGLLVGALLSSFEKFRNLRRGKAIIIAIAAGICLLYAMTDEFHQGFVDGRSPKVMDVLIDTAGGFSGVVFFVLVWLFFIKIKQNLWAKRKER